MPYIGTSPQFGVRKKHTYTATAGQTSFSGAGSEGVTLSYKDSNYVDVYQNGVKLGDADYTSTSGTAIVLAQAASVNDLVEIIVFDVFSISDTVSKADGGTFDNPITITTDDNSVNLNLVSTDADANSGPELELYRNSASPADDDFVGTISFKAENDADEKIEYGVLKTRIVDASDGTEDFRMTFEGKVAGSDAQLLKMDNSNIVFNEDSKDIDFRVESDSNTHGIFLDAGAGLVGIGNSNPDGHYNLADDLVIGNGSGGRGLTIYSASDGSGNIAFNDTEQDAMTAYIQYHHSTNHMQFNTSVGNQLEIHDTDGLIEYNGAFVHFHRGSVNNNASVSIDIPDISSAGATMVFAFYTHHAIQNYGAARVSTLGMYLGSVVSTHDIQNITSSGGGSFTYSSPGSNVLRITKTAGTYIGGGHYVIRVETYAGPS